jgi:hypothetical protein
MKTHNSLAVSIATALSLAIVTPAFAQIAPSNNGGVGNSNLGGVINTSPGGVPSFGSPGSSTTTGYSTTVLEQAKALQQQLADAQSVQACSGTRSFLRTPQACPTNEKLIKAKADATAFLESVKTPGPNLLAAPATAVAKSNPTW